MKPNVFKAPLTCYGFRSFVVKINGDLKYGICDANDKIVFEPIYDFAVMLPGMPFCVLSIDDDEGNVKIMNADLININILEDWIEGQLGEHISGSEPYDSNTFLVCKSDNTFGVFKRENGSLEQIIPFGPWWIEHTVFGGYYLKKHGDKYGIYLDASGTPISRGTGDEIWDYLSPAKMDSIENLDSLIVLDEEGNRILNEGANLTPRLMRH